MVGGHQPVANGASVEFPIGNVMNESQQIIANRTLSTTNQPALGQITKDAPLSESIANSGGRGGVSFAGGNLGKQFNASETQTIYAAPTANMGSAGIGESHDQTVIGR